jgi:hypothetical protein
MSEMDSAVEKFSHCYNRHGGTLLLAKFNFEFRSRLLGQLSAGPLASLKTPTSELDRGGTYWMREVTAIAYGAGQILPDY